MPSRLCSAVRMLAAVVLAGGACTWPPTTRGRAACDGIACSGHGKCAVVRGDPACACDPGHRPEGLNCLPLAAPAAPATAGPPPVVPTPPAPMPAELAPAAPAQPRPPPPAVPPSAVPPHDAEHDRLCALVLDALAVAPAAGGPALAETAKRDAVARYRDHLKVDCLAFLWEAKVEPDAVRCAAAAFEAALREGVGLDVLAARDPLVAACGGTWKTIAEARADALRRVIAAQRERFGVAVFGFHRAYRFEGGATAETCRRFFAAVPGAPEGLLAPQWAPAADWRERLDACGKAVDGAGLAPLLRWCLVDRAPAVISTRSGAPCEAYARPDEKEPLGRAVGALLAILPPGGGPGAQAGTGAQ